ncbi:MAG: polysaccharide deacetylase family protein [Acidobacteriia bacterium]|nr:polysaccharide deacetylase family protein [Terriglobia bacterium]
MAHKVRRFLFCLGAGLLYYSGILPLWFLVRDWMRGGEGVCVIGLHRVLSEEQECRANSLEGIVMRERTFAKLLDYLGRHFAVLSLDAFLDGRRAPGSKPRCLLTFDDGWRDNYTTALPWLKKHRMPAVIFVVTGFIEERNTFWVERLIQGWRSPEQHAGFRKALEDSTQGRLVGTTFEGIVEHLKNLPAQNREALLASWISAAHVEDGNPDETFTWEEAADLQKEGIDIEAHSFTHPLLVYEDEQTVSRELAGSKRMLEERLKKKVRAFAYPNGTWDDRVRRQVQMAGYDCAFTTAPGWHHRGDDIYTIRRIMLHEGKVTGVGGEFSPAALAVRLSGLR